MNNYNHNEYQKNYQKNYKKEKLERVSFDVNKGSRDIIKKIAKSKNKSVNQYLKDLIKKDSGINL